MSPDTEEPQHDDPHLRRVTNWIESSGRALELRTGRFFAHTGFVTSTSVFYTDPTAGKVREGDVLAVRNVFEDPEDNRSTVLGRLILSVECKHSAGTNPWVGFTEGKVRHRTMESWSPAQQGVDLLAPGIPLLPSGTVAHSIVEIEKRDNPADNAARQALSWATSFRDRQLLGPFIVLPVVVTTHPLYTAELDSSGAVVTTPVDWMGVITPVSDTGTSRPSADSGYCKVHIVREAGLPEFAAAMNRFFYELDALVRYRSTEASAQDQGQRQDR